MGVLSGAEIAVLRHGIAAAMAIALSAIPDPSHAQQATAADAEQGLEEIVVSARKVNENLQDVPVAITAFSGAELKQQNLTTVYDLQRLTPSLSIRTHSGSALAMIVNLRGQVQTDTVVTSDPSVGIYVDDIYWARAYGVNSELLDVESVQVLRGPQGTLFGRNTTGGAMLFKTNDPNFDGVEGYVEGTYGRFNERVATGIVNLPVVDDRLAIRAAVQRSVRDGWSRDISIPGLRHNDRDSWQGRLKILFKPTESLSLLLSATYFDGTSNGSNRRIAYIVPNNVTPPAMTPEVSAAAVAAGFPATYPAIGASAATTYGLANIRAQIAVLGTDPDITSSNLVSFDEARAWTYNATATIDTFFGQIKALGSYRRSKAAAYNDLDGSIYPIIDSLNRSNIFQYSGELQATGKAFGNHLDFATGFFVFKEKGPYNSISISNPATNLLTQNSGGIATNETMGAYAQGTFRLADRLSLTGGLRYSIDDRELEGHNINTNRNTGVVTCQIAGLIPPSCQLTKSVAQGAISYTAGADYRFTDDVMAYAKTSKGYRSGGYNLRTGSLNGAVPFRPEIAYSHEAGLKSELLNRRLRINLAGYYTLVKDLQRTIVFGLPGGGSSTQAVNAGKARIWGVEVEAAAQITDDFVIQLSGATTRPKYLEYRELIGRTDLNGDKSSERYEITPKWAFSVSGQYNRDFGGVKLTARTDYSWQSRQNLTPVTPFLGDPTGVTIDPTTGTTIAQELIRYTTQPAAGILSGRLSLAFDDGRYELALFGRNLTDNRDPVLALYLSGIGFVSQSLREPRTYGVTGTLRFGQ